MNKLTLIILLAVALVIVGALIYVTALNQKSGPPPCEKENCIWVLDRTYRWVDVTEPYNEDE
jgi:hypothetical protein